MSRYLHVACTCLVIAVAFAGGVAAGASPPASLKEAFASKFRVGVAIGTDTLTSPDKDALEVIAREFNSATPENLLKWASIHSAPGRYDFEAADRFVEFGERHGLFLVGHTLIWHEQTPAWVFQDEHGGQVSREELLARMREHIHKVVGRYRGRIHAWDVVNEALNDDGTMRDTPWREIIGDSYPDHAFRFAKEADPDCELYYNDFNLFLPDKRRGVVRLIDLMNRSGIHVDGIGMQGHWGLDFPQAAEIEESIRTYAEIVDKVMITELDINVLPRPKHPPGADIQDRASYSAEMDPYQAGLPESVQQQLADQYAMLFKIFVRHQDVIDRVTFWGLDDGQSWHNNWPIRGRTAHSLLFDRSLAPKPAYHALLEVAADVRP